MALVQNSVLRMGALAAQFSAPAPVGSSGSPLGSAVGESAAAAALSASVQAHLDAAQASLDALLAIAGPRTIDNTLRVYDALLLHLDAAANMPGLLERVHPDPAVRQVAEEWTQSVDRFATALSLNRDVFEALQATDMSGADDVTRFYLEKTLREYRRAGVDKDDATRERIRALNEELTLIGQEFARNIQSDTRTVYVTPADLAGLPDDYVQSHVPDEDGRIGITTDYPDYVPFMSYSKSDSAREQLYKTFRNRGYPGNVSVLARMLAKRHQLATLLGYKHWADYITENKMVGSDQAAREFIEKIARIAEKRSQVDYQQLLQAKQRLHPGATDVTDWEKGYYEEIVKSSEYQFDSQSVRPYYPYGRVKDGVMQITSRMFGVEFRRATGAATWSEEVETYDVLENGNRIGRFHLDMHPRSDKFKHAAQFTILNGVAGKQLPEAALVCNFPGGEVDEPGLMEQEDVETFFHEFGHLLHTIFAGRQPWMGVAGISTEWDFVEAPSQMLEEWARNVDVLQSFARHYRTNEPIPADLVARMKRAAEFGKGAFVRQQMYYAMLSLSFYDRDPEGLDTTQLSRDLMNQYSVYKYVDGTHFELSFGHLDGYSAIYYTYMWSLVIAKDMFSKFGDNLLATEMSRAYRDAVLAAGGSAPAAKLVERFLGRPYGFEAYEAWLNAD